MPINLSIPQNDLTLRPKITVVGVGGAGGNAVANMIRAKLEGVDFIVANTDAQSLAQSLCQRRIQLGAGLTKGLGAGARPDIGRAAAEEAMRDITEQLAGSNMCFITAGMGGGTGTGAAPVVAQLAREQGILTVGVITKPFHFEGTHRMRMAESGIQELAQYVDTLIVIPNQNLFRIANEKTTFADAFRLADEVLHLGVRGVTDLMTMPGLINLDFADVQTIMSGMGKAMMGTGEATGDNRALMAAEAAISNPLLDEVSMKGARGVLINITGGPDLTLFEVDEAANRIRDEVDPEANIIFGSTTDPDLEGKVRISVVATGIDQAQLRQPAGAQLSLVSHNPKPQMMGASSPDAAMLGISMPMTGYVEKPMMSPNVAAASSASIPAPTMAVASVHMGAPASFGANALAMPSLAEVEASVQAPMFEAPKTSVETARMEASIPAAPSAALSQGMASSAMVARQDAPVQAQAAQAQAAQTHVSQPVPSRAPVAPTRAPNLFQRMTKRLTGQSLQAAPAAQPAKAEPAFVAPQATRQAAAAPAGEARRVENTAQPQLAFDAPERVSVTRAEEEMLDIPAFLRRQAN